MKHLRSAEILVWHIFLCPWPGDAEIEIPAEAAQVLPPCDNAEIAIATECPGGAETNISWVLYAQSLYLARSELVAYGVSSAITAVHRVLRGVVTRFSQSFECLPALIASYFSLAHLLVLQGRARRALAMIHMGFIFVRDRGFSECTPWPVQGFNMMLAGRGLAARIRELDKQSVVLVPPSHRNEDMRIAVVTICAYAKDEPVRVVCNENRKIYSALHGYDIHFFTDASEIQVNQEAGMDVGDGVHKPFFWKVNAVKNVLETGKYDWVLWADCDAFFMDPARTLDSVISMYSGNMSLATTLAPFQHGEAEELSSLRRRLYPDAPTNVSLILAIDSTGINNGVWLLRNSPWSHDFLWRWWHSDILDGPGREHNCSDQSTMVHTLLHDRAMDLDEMWDSVEGPIWPLEVRIAAQEHLQSFHQATALTAMSRAWTEGDFIKHHPGCHYYQPACQYLYNEAETLFRQKVQAAQTRSALTGQ